MELRIGSRGTAGGEGPRRSSAQFVAVFLMNLGVAALSKDFETIVDEPSTFLTKLAQNVPGAFAFFTSFLLVRALIESSVLLLDAPGAILFWLFGKLAPTPRTRERLLDVSPGLGTWPSERRPPPPSSWHRRAFASSACEQSGESLPLESPRSCQCKKVPRFFTPRERVSVPAESKKRSL